MEDKSAAAQIDDIIKLYDDWRGATMAQLRKDILGADPKIIEEVKWKMATRPQGLPVWSHDGIVCFLETWKDNLKLLFPKGAQLQDPKKLFNSRLKSNTTRGIEIREGDELDPAALQALVQEAIGINTTKS